MVPIFHGTITPDVVIAFDDEEQARRRGYLRRLVGQRVDVVVTIHRNRRSARQNRYWFGIVIPLIAHDLGWDKHDHERLHYALVSACFGSHVDPILQQTIPNVRSSKLSTKHFAELIDWAIRWAAVEHGILIPSPDDVLLGAA